MIHFNRLVSLTDIENDFHLRVMGLDFHIDGFHRIHFNLTIFTDPSARAGYDTRSIFKQSLTGLNSEFSFS